MSDKDICGARIRDRGVCQRPAGWGTTHLGSGRCYFHEYKQLDNPATPTKRMLELMVKHPDSRDEILQILQDPDLLDARAELAELKRQFWALKDKEPNEDEDPLYYVKEMRYLAAEITKMAKRIQELEMGKQHYIHISVTGQILEVFGRLVRSYIHDPDMRKEFVESCQQVISQSLSGDSARQIASGSLEKVADGEDIIEGEIKEIQEEAESLNIDALQDALKDEGF